MNDFKKLNATQRMLYRQLYKTDLHSFFVDFWETFDTAKLVDGPLIQFYCEFYQYLLRNFIPVEVYDKPIELPPVSDDVVIIDVRKENKRNGCLNVPPSHCKSACLNVAAAVWTIINCPMEIASVSHTEGLSTEMNKKRQRIMNSDMFKFFFPEIQLVENSSSKLVDNRNSNLYSVNRNSFTGYHASVIVADDITNARTAVRDKVEMQNATDFYRDTLPSRLSDPLTGVILNIMQRLSNSDITSLIQNDANLSSQYIFVSLPAQFEKETYLVCPISGDVIHFDVGDYLWPQRFGDYSSLKAQVGSRVWATQYLQKPTSPDDAIVREDFFREMDATEVPGYDNGIDMMNVDMIYCSHDLAIKGTKNGDFTGSTLAYKIKKTLYFVDCAEEKQDFIQSLEFVKSRARLYPNCTQIVETAANGNPLLTTLQDEVSNLHGYSPAGTSKEERLSFATPYMVSGNVVFVKTKWDGEKWRLSDGLANLKDKLLAFPNVQHDDIVDAFSQCVNYVYTDAKYSVYGRSFNDENLLDTSSMSYDYSTTFFNKEGDQWKVLDIGIKYGMINQLIILKEKSFKANIDTGLKLMKEFTPDKNVFIDCSVSSGLYGIYNDDYCVERYECPDFDASVVALNYAFSENKIIVDTACKGLQADIDAFKYDKGSRDKTKYSTNKDGYVACLRVASRYYGGI